MITRMSVHFPRTMRDMRGGLTRSQELLEQAGFIRGADAAGVYHLLPLGWRVHQKVCAIVFDEMEREGVQNMQLPILQSREKWEQTDRWKKYLDTKVMFVTRDHHSGAEFGLAPTAEEMVTALAASEIQSYKELPVSLHQIGAKFRDELRPRMGLLRCREFYMSDAYSFDRDEAGMRQSFEMYRRIYQRIFDRAGLISCISVQADSGAIGGQGSAEFMAVCGEAGEDLLLTCNVCDYGANAEKAQSLYGRPVYDATHAGIRHEATPDIKTVEDLRGFFPEITPDRMIKTIICTVNPDSTEPYEVAVCVRGDLEINLTKLTNALNADSVATSDPIVVRQVTGAEVGFAGPLGLRNVRQILFDESCQGMTNFLCGFNTTDHHALNVNFGRDIDEPDRFFDLHIAKQGHGCPMCEGGVLSESRGIEVGHIFMLQTGYAEKLGAYYIADDGSRRVMWMGCYGIGTTRLMQAIAEQNNDADGLIWPENVAPYLVHVTVVKASDPTQRKVADSIVQRLHSAGNEVLYDDRDDASPAVKFKDADLIGCPWRVTVGRKASTGVVELRDRRNTISIELTTDNVTRQFDRPGLSV